MVVELDSALRLVSLLIMIITMMMMIMMKMKWAITQIIFKLGPSDFA